MSAPEPKEDSARWPFGLGTINEVPARFPPSKIDATAKRVAAIGRRLESGAAARPGIQSYLSKQIARPDDSADAASAAVRHFLDEHAATIDELRRALSGGVVPGWPIDVTAPHEDVVDLATQRSLFRILAADAIDRHSRGDDATAWRDAETGWMLARGLWAQPYLPSRLTALSGTRLMNAVAAKLSAPPPDWHRQLLAFDADREFAVALQVEAWFALTAWDRRHALRTRDDGTEVWSGSAEAVLRTLTRRGTVSFATSRRTVAEEIARPHACGQARHDRSRLAIAILIRSDLDGFHLEREAAAKLLALKEQRRRSGEWPEAMAGIGKSLCGEDSWRYRREVDGSMSLSFVKPLTEDGTAFLPLSFRYPK